jgi:hypothetical protein
MFKRFAAPGGEARRRGAAVPPQAASAALALSTIA